MRSEHNTNGPESIITYLTNIVLVVSITQFSPRHVCIAINAHNIGAGTFVRLYSDCVVVSLNLRATAKQIVDEHNRKLWAKFHQPQSNRERERDNC